MQRTDRFPDFFVIGAPRCGTTAISKYLSKNPHICFSRPKEPHFFSIMLQEKPDADIDKDYLGLFFRHCSDTCQAIGEGSVSYLYYPEAIKRIQQLNPQARFIVMARNPIDMIHSYHARLLAILDEDVEDFATAWELQEARARGEHLPVHCRTPYLLQYAEVGRIGKHVEQLFQTAGRDRCHVVLFDDFVTDTLGSYRQVLDFIGADYDGRTVFPPVEVSKFYRSRWLHLLLKRPPMKVIKYTLNIEQRARRKGRKKSRLKRFRKWLLKKNTVLRKRPPLEPEMRDLMRATFAEDIEKLGRLLDRDLSHWR
jgi:hypothetical protein